MARRDRGLGLLASRSVLAAEVPEERRAPRLVERRPGADSVTEDRVHVRRVVGEEVGGVAVGPAALLLKRLRQVPVVEGQPRRDALLEQGVDESRVEVEALRVDRAAVGTNPRPRRREAVGAAPRGRSSTRRLRRSGDSGRTRPRRSPMPMIAPGTRANASQIESARPSSWAAPSIWYAAVATPKTKSRGKDRCVGPAGTPARASARGVIPSPPPP